jgi:uncharacterized membrane protein
MWYPSPWMMACSILIRNSMRFFRYFLLSNLVQKGILEKSLQIAIFRPYIFASFHQVLSKLLLWFRSKRIV